MAAQQMRYERCSSACVAQWQGDSAQPAESTSRTALVRPPIGTARRRALASCGTEDRCNHCFAEPAHRRSQRVLIPRSAFLLLRPFGHTPTCTNHCACCEVRAAALHRLHRDREQCALRSNSVPPALLRSACVQQDGFMRARTRASVRGWGVGVGACCCVSVHACGFACAASARVRESN